MLRSFLAITFSFLVVTSPAHTEASPREQHAGRASAMSLKQARHMQLNFDSTQGALALLDIALSRIPFVHHHDVVLGVESIDACCATILLTHVFPTGHPDPAIRKAFVESGAPAVLPRGTPEEAAYSVSAIWKLFPRARGIIIDRLQVLVSSSKDDYRMAAAFALRYGIADRTQTTRLLNTLATDPNWKVRSEATATALTLGRSGSVRTQFVSSLLVRALNDEEDVRVRVRALEALSLKTDVECTRHLAVNKTVLRQLLRSAKDVSTTDDFLRAAVITPLAVAPTAEEASELLAAIARQRLLDGHENYTVQYHAVELIAHLSRKQLADVPSYISSGGFSGSYRDSLRSTAKLATSDISERQEIASIVRAIRRGANLELIGSVLGQHNPEALSLIIEDAATPPLNDSAGYALGLALLHVPAHVGKRHRSTLRRLLKTDDEWLRAGAAICMLVADIDSSNAAGALNEVINNVQVDIRIRALAMRSLPAAHRLTFVRGASLEAILARVNEVHDPCELEVVCGLLAAIANGADFDERAVDAIYDALQRPDVSPCYRLSEAMLLTIPKISSHTSDHDFRMLVRHIRKTVHSDDIRQTADAVMMAL